MLSQSLFISSLPFHFGVFFLVVVRFNFQEFECLVDFFSFLFSFVIVELFEDSVHIQAVEL